MGTPCAKIQHEKYALELSKLLALVGHPKRGSLWNPKLLWSVARDKTRDTVTTHSIMKHVDTAQRVALSNQTNASHTDLYSPEQRHLKRRVLLESTVDKKRLKVEKTQHDLQTRGDVHQDLTTSSGHRNCTNFRALRAMQMRSRRVIDGASSKSRTRTYKFWLIARPSLFQTITRVICVLSKVGCLSIPFTG